MKDELKTLNEIKIDVDKYLGIAFKNREDQKTEEDKKIWDKEGDIIFVSDIKKELGIKWIKKLKEEDEKCESFIELFDRDPDATYGAMFILKKIFNISEKDLE